MTPVVEGDRVVRAYMCLGTHCIAVRSSIGYGGTCGVCGRAWLNHSVIARMRIIAIYSEGIKGLRRMN